MEKEKTLPEKKYRAGAIQATIWNNKTKEFEYRTVSLERSYKDKTGTWKSTGVLRVNDLPKAQLVLAKAYEYLALVEKDE